MKTRLELHEKLKDLLGSDNVYYQPPSNIQMKYPAIRYTKKRISKIVANDASYQKNNLYEIIVISKMPDDPVIEKILDLPYSSYDNSHTADNLNHDVISLYY